MFWTLLCVLLLTTTIVSAGNVYPGHNSNFYLQNASGYTLCSDTSTGHSYWTIGNANNTHSTRLTVYLLNASGGTVDIDTSSSTSTYASAWWTRSATTTHRHRALAALIGR